MITNVENLRKAKDSYVCGLLEVILKYNYEEGEKIVFCFVEGKDFFYYKCRVSAHLSEFEFYSAKGKERLKELLRAIKSNTSLSSIKYIAFFDRDYEFDLDEIRHDCNFVTSGYSLENKYTKYKSVKDIVRDLFFCCEFNEDINDSLCKIMDIYRKTQRSFHQSVELFNKWAWVQRYRKKSGSLNLDQFSIVENCKIDFLGMNVTREYDLEKLNSLFVRREPVTPAELSEAAEWFAGKEVQQAYRGKQEAEFLFEFIKFLSERGGKGEYPFKEKVTAKGISFSRKELVQQFAACVGSTDNFRNFMIKTKERLKTM